MTSKLLDHFPSSKEGRLLLMAVIIEASAIVSSYFIVLALLDGAWDATPGRAFLLGYAMWTIPVSAWIGIRGSGISFENSAFGYLGPALIVAALTGVAVWTTGIVVDIFDCGGGGSPGATGSSGSGSGCERVFPSFTTLLAFSAAAVAMFSILASSLLIGFIASNIRSWFEQA